MPYTLSKSDIQVLAQFKAIKLALEAEYPIMGTEAAPRAQNILIAIKINDLTQTIKDTNIREDLYRISQSIRPR